MAADVERRRPTIAADAVVLVHDRRARPQVREIADDLFGIALGAAPAPLLPGALAEQLLFRDHRERRARVEHQACRERRYRDAELRAACDEGRASRRRARGRRLRRCRMSSSISRRPADSAAISTRPWKSPRKRASSRAGSSLRGSMRSPGGAPRREVLIGQGLRQRIELDSRQLDPAQRAEPLHQLVRRREHFARARGSGARCRARAARSGSAISPNTCAPRPARRVSAATIVLPGR